MTHEPDAIRDEKFVPGGIVYTPLTWHSTGQAPEAIVFSDGTVHLNDAAKRSRFLSSKFNTVRVSDEPWRDYGDESDRLEG